ncbi:helix-turn-helix domain-containing protein [Streptomyces seoulensis]
MTGKRAGCGTIPGEKLEEALGRAVREGRRKTGMTQTRLAELSGLTQAAVSRLEHGRCMPTLPLLERIAQALGSALLVAVEPGRGVTVTFSTAAEKSTAATGTATAATATAATGTVPAATGTPTAATVPAATRTATPATAARALAAAAPAGDPAAPSSGRRPAARPGRSGVRAGAATSPSAS